MFDRRWYKFQLYTEVFILGSAKFQSQILLQGIFEVTNIGIYHPVIIEKSEKKFSFTFPFIMKIKEVF